MCLTFNAFNNPKRRVLYDKKVKNIRQKKTFRNKSERFINIRRQKKLIFYP